MASRNNRKKKSRQQKKEAKNAEEDILKAQADDALKSQKYDKALQLYTQAIEYMLNNKPQADDEPEDDGEAPAAGYQEKLSALYSNRSQAQFQLKTFADAIKDADEAIKLFPKRARAYFRKGQALEATLAYEEAVKVYNKGLEIEPGNAQLEQALKDLQMILDDIEATQKRIAAQVNPDQDKYEKMVQWLIKGGAKVR
jgi:tetratricopeptide (TPR) repeat protein